jgi:hypothetical protein
MKKVILMMVAAILLGLSACTNKENTCIKDIVAILTEGAKQNQADDVDNLFIMPDGNVFANEKVLAIVEANKDYKLTDEDKSELKKAVQLFKTHKADSEEAIMFEASKMIAEIEDTQVQWMESNIDAAKSLGDLVE